MIAYNKIFLRNREVGENALAALRKKLIPKEEYTAINTAYPDKLYTPNLFYQDRALPPGHDHYQHEFRIFFVC